MTNLTDADLAAMKARADAATPGPWETCHAIFSDGMHVSAVGSRWNIAEDVATEDAEFIAAAREDVPALLEALKDKTVEVAALRQQLDLAENFIADADHTIRGDGCNYWATRHADQPLPCTCWKADYEAERSALK